MENSLYIHDQIGEYRDRGEMLEEFSYLDFFLQTYDRTFSTGDEGCRGRPKSVKIPYHEDSIRKNRCRCLRSEQAEVIPNFPGKWFASCNIVQDLPLHCASMLALLKPWRCLSDLKDHAETFIEAFDRFRRSASSRVLDTIENIQYFHECSESARKRREAAEDMVFDEDHAKFDVPIEDEDDAEDCTPQNSAEAAITEAQVQYALQHPFSTREALYAQTAMNVAFDKGFFEDELSPTSFRKPLPLSTTADIAECARLHHAMSSIDTEDSDLSERNGSIMDKGSVSAYQEPSAELTYQEPEVTRIECQDNESGADEDLTETLHMNTEQKRALDIIRAQLHRRIHNQPFSQLLMVICGEGGTGKSALIDEITRTYASAGCSSRLAKTAMSGVAASIIGGSTLHSWAGLPSRTPHSDNWMSSSSREVKARRRSNMIGTWLLGVDEASMMTAEQLAMLSEVDRITVCILWDNLMT
jgi:hypothetical protein